ncbi:glycerol-3-phosphate dehydrogenase/oxidase [Corynebacterium lubricantis]|uniref:glycerol-3-phosphate dehydrogenase/oxidase n=1 Tax=Corynebacterium lubricantis TaxID=541095 RepID=UPI000364C595|nr:glycerol-3-phosphate dehydrogenase/oxidase [Corynebacterium lubricantis]
MKDSTRLNASRRATDLHDLATGTEGVDVVVIGGGITGVGIALDAATRGLSTVLVEKHDLAFGTSRFSSKLVHGGLRYLTKMEFGIARDSAVERGIIMERTAPHLVRSLPQVTALGSDTNLFQKAAMRVGFLAGDVLRKLAGTSVKTLPRSRYAGPEEAALLCPAVARDNLRGAWVNFDGQMVDDARFVTAVARTAASEGARILTQCEVLSADGTSVRVRDRIDDNEFTLQAKAVINASGVWAGNIDHALNFRPARGTHVVIDADRLGNPQGALTVPLPGSISRYLFLLPAPHGRVYLGLTDEDNGPEIPEVPATPQEDIDFLLTHINRALDKDLTHDDVIGAFTGLRPLLDTGEDAATADLSRRHHIIESENGVISIVGGKFTEYRLMAEETLDEVVRLRNLSARRCVTTTFPLIGAPGHRDYAHVAPRDLSDLPESIVQRFGREAPEVISDATVERPLDLVTGTDLTRAEIEFAVTAEGALSVEDVLERRTRIALVPADAEAAREEVISIVNHALEAVR